MKYVFGPVMSRRLGRSLGVDLVPLKTCSLDCVYCQVGKTTNLTAERAPYVPAGEVISELEKRLSENPALDVVTFSGSGEPTLHSEIGRIIEAAERLTEKPVVVLTNGTLLSDASLREDLMKADVVIPSLDAGSAEVFERVNRPAPGIVFDEYVDGLVEFSKTYKGKLILEVFFALSVNDTDEAARDIAAVAGKIRHDGVEINTAARPVPGGGNLRVPDGRLEELARFFGPEAELITRRDVSEAERVVVDEEKLFDLISRRPVTIDEAADALSIDRREASKALNHLAVSGKARTIDRDGLIFYFMK